MGFLSAIASLAASLAKGLVGLFFAKNSPQMQANEEAKRLQALKDAVTADVAKGDITKVQDDIAP